MSKNQTPLARGGSPSERRPAVAQGVGERLLLTVEEAAERLCVGQTYMFDLVGTGVVPSIRLGKLRRIRAEDLERYVSSLQ